MATTKATELSQLSSALQVDESTGEIIFTGSLSVDSNTLFIDGDANRVGIGTLTPGSALDVGLNQGNIKFLDLDSEFPSSDSGILFDGSGSVSSGIFTEVDGEILSYGINVSQLDSNYDQARSGGIFRLDTRTGDGVPYNRHAFIVKGRSENSTDEFDAFGVDLNTGDTIISPDKGNVGIGTSSPFAKLDVIGSLRAAKYESTDNYPTIKPSLNLDFANTKSLDPRIDFTRASTATYYDERGILRTAASNEPRFDHDPDTGESKGLLIEEQRTNLLRYSENWTAGGFTDGWSTASNYFSSLVSSDHPYRPDIQVCYFGPESGVGSFTNDVTQQITTLGPAGTYYIYQDLKAVGSTSHVRFLPVPNDGGTGTVGGVLRLINEGGVRADNFSPGDSFSSQELGSYPIGNGWYRCWIKFTTTRTIGQFRATRAFPYIGTSEVVGDEVSGLEGTMAQLEEGAFPTSYIPTTDSQVTRVQDSAKIQLGDEFNPTEFTVFVDAPNFSEGQTNPSVFSIDNDSGDINPSVFSYIANNYESYVFSVRNSSGPIADDFGVGSSSSGKIALSVDQNQMNWAASGITGSETLSADLPDYSGFYLRLGDHISGAVRPHRITFKSASMYPRALPNAVLQTLTEE